MIDYRLCVCTDRSVCLGRPQSEYLRAAVLGGATIVQFREKNAEGKELLRLAQDARDITRELQVPLIVNDHVELAVRVGADGVHLGQQDMSLKEAKGRFGQKLIYGISVGTIEEAVQAEAGGADYLGVGPVFKTATKLDAGAGIGLKMVKEICEAVQIPVVAIGGIYVDNAAKVFAQGVTGIAVISGLIGQPDVEKAAQKLRACAP